MFTLHKFQDDALKQIQEHQWEMYRRGTPDTSVLIGDDMGLGKTIEAIELDAGYRKAQQSTGKTLVVTMTSVMGAWEKHYNNWAPQLKVKVIDRKNRQEFVEALKSDEYQIFVCHWQGLRFIHEELQTVGWFHIIGDEIQNIKNRKAQQTQYFKKLRTVYKTGLSGTWADNRPDDAWSVLNWLWPKRWTSYWAFFNRHVMQKKHNDGTCLAEGCGGYHRRSFTEVCGFAEVDTIHQAMGMAYVRRTKEEVWEDIPEKTYDDIPVDLHPKQRSAYDAMAKDMLAWVGKNEDQPVPAVNVVSQLVRLQQFAVAYGKLVTKINTVKYTERQLEFRALKGLPYATSYQVPTQYLELDEPSCKLDATMDLIEATNGQVVVFGQSKQAINLLAARLRAAKIPHGVLTGDTKQTDRDLFIEEFQAGKRRVFCSTIKAGGVGITLTAASICIFLDWDWSPTKNKQAEDRLHRLGQKNAVLILRLVARDTVDRRRNERIEMKWEWLKAVLDPAVVRS